MRWHAREVSPALARPAQTAKEPRALPKTVLSRAMARSRLGTMSFHAAGAEVVKAAPDADQSRVDDASIVLAAQQVRAVARAHAGSRKTPSRVCKRCMRARARRALQSPAPRPCEAGGTHVRRAFSASCARARAPAACARVVFVLANRARPGRTVVSSALRCWL